MPAPKASCELFIDGVRVPDTGAQLVSGVVTALEGLTLAWGRDGQNEQPGAASMSMDFIDPAGNDDILDVLHVGSDVQLWAAGDIPGTEAEPWGDNTMENGTFPWPDGDPPPNTVQDLSGTIAKIDNQTLRISHPKSSAIVRVPPRAFSPAGQTPDAWDDIPKVSIGEAWLLELDVKVPAGSRFWPAITLYSAPYPTHNVAGGGWWVDPPNLAWVGTGDWQHVTATWTRNSGEVGWAGLEIRADGVVGRRWYDQTTAWEQQTATWADQWAEQWIDNVEIRPPGQGTNRRVLVFSGQVSDVKVAPSGDSVSTLIAATAMDQAAILGNTTIGDTPWPVHTAQVRADRITQLAGITTSPRIRIDDPIETLQLTARDVDSQPAFDLLQDLAQSIGGVLWVATHAVTGPFLWIEDPTSRAAVQTFTESGGSIIITGATRDVSLISACDILESDVEWSQDTADVITVAAVTWQEQGVDEELQPTVTDRTYTATADQATIAKYGTRRLSISTELIAETDAATIANRALAQARAVEWRLNGLTMDTAVLEASLDSIDDATRQMTLLNLLDGTIRMGMAVTLVDMPPYAPRGSVSSVYVEGGKYEYTAGYWMLTLTTSPSSGQGQSAKWEQLDPAWAWQDFHPDITWQDLYGVTA